MTAKQPKRKTRAGVDQYGRTPLHHAAILGDVSVVASLLAGGANGDAQDDDGWTPLHFAAQERNLDVTRLLLKRGASPNLTDRHGNGPLWTAVMNARGDTSVVVVLLRAGADPQHDNAYGRSPLDMATTIVGDLREVFERESDGAA